MKLSDLRYVEELRKENRRLFAYLIRKKNMNRWTKVLVEQIVKLNISIIEEILK